LHYIIPDNIAFCTTGDAVDWIATDNFSKEQIVQQGYYLEPPMSQSWQAMLEDIAKMCYGIASKFNQQSAEETDNLASEALVQVISKIARGRLRYTPGRAPVFNLLTTTIHRCIYSILSKDTRQRKNFTSFADNLIIEETGVVRASYSRTHKTSRVKIDR
jgi:DNA-directed RNA polymerase specialized sigma24 family protein